MKRFMSHILNILKGICIGIANVIPGFSGGTMAVMLKVYDLFVYCFANIFNDFKNVIKKGWSLFIGIALGVVLALFTIVKLLEVIPFITIMFFVGLVLGSLPTIYKKAKVGKIRIINLSDHTLQGKKHQEFKLPGSSQALPAITCVIWSKSLQILSLKALISENQWLA